MLMQTHPVACAMETHGWMKEAMLMQLSSVDGAPGMLHTHVCTRTHPSIPPNILDGTSQAEVL